MTGALLLAAVLGAVSARASASPESAIRDFLDWHERPMKGSFSSGANLPRLRGLLSAELLCLLQATDRYHDRYAKRFPQDKPPYADGDMFLSSGWEHPVKADIEAARIYGADSEVWVRFEDAYATSWRDRFRLRLEGGAWKVADVDKLSRFQDREGQWRVERASSLVTELYRNLDRNQAFLHWRRQEVSDCGKQH